MSLVSATTGGPLATVPAAPTAASTSSSWTFTQGLILGQASFLLLLLLFMRYVVFSPSEAADPEGWKKRRAERAKKPVLSTTAAPAPLPSQILNKTNYEMGTHPAESADWLNVLLAQMLQGYRNDMLSDGGEDGARLKIEQWLNPPGGKLSWLDPIEVTGLSLGTSYPLLSNARIRPADGQGRIRAEMDLDYYDSVSLSLQTSVLINFPRPRFAVLPVALGVELVSLGGTLSLQLHDPHEGRQHVHACLLPDFHLNLKTTSLLGSRAKLQDIPKLEQLIVSRLRSIVQDRLVHPRHLSLALPRILSPSISPTPVLSDLGDGAVKAMSEAMREGVGRMVDDLGGLVGVVPASPPPRPTSAGGGGQGGVPLRDLDSYNTSRATSVGSASVVEQDTAAAGAAPSVRVVEPSSPVRPARKIVMPPGMTTGGGGHDVGSRGMQGPYGSGSVTPTVPGHLPLTPGVNADGRDAARRQDSYMGQHGGISRAGMGQTSAISLSGAGAMPGGGLGSIAGAAASSNAPSSLAPSQSQCHFRFRGQFASGGSGVPTEGSEGGARRTGALNSRAM